MRSYHRLYAGVIASALVTTAVAQPIRPVVSPKIHPTVHSLFAGSDTALVWVFFVDKGPIDMTAALQDLPRTYNQRAVERRRLRRTAPGLFDKRDLAVHGSYVNAVTALGTGLRTTSRWLNAVSVTADQQQIQAIAKLPFVEKVQPVRKLRRTPQIEVAPSQPQSQAAAGLLYGLTEDQVVQINLMALHQQGYTGDGVIIGVLDTGFKTTHNAFNVKGHPLQVVAEYDFVNDDGETGPEAGDLSNQHHHGTQVLGTMATYWPNGLVGTAYDASYILAKAEDLAAEYAAEENLFVAGLEFIEANGGDVATSSLVIFDFYTQAQLDGLTSVMTVGFNTATANGLHCCQGAGNDGHDTDPATSNLLPPADAFSVITCGAVDSLGNTASFTSDGPTADGRVKPEVLARGVSTWTVSPVNDAGVQAVNGTSFATPMTAGAVACLVQAHPEWTVEQMRYALTHTADYYIAEQTFDPLFIRGYGIVDAFAASQITPPAPGDLDQDGVVGITDFLALLGAWGPCPEPCPPDCFGDVDTDCTVGISDLLTLLANWTL
ncbi:MAG: S8 family serine peptidase [Phycisphaerales bacterium]